MFLFLFYKEKGKKRGKFKKKEPFIFFKNISFFYGSEEASNGGKHLIACGGASVFFFLINYVQGSDKDECIKIR